MKYTQVGVIVRIQNSGPNWTFSVRDLKTGERRELTSWEALRSHLEALTKPGLK